MPYVASNGSGGQPTGPPPTATNHLENTTMANLDIHETVVDTVVKTQNFVLENLTKATDFVSEQLPAVPVGPADEYVAKGAELTDGGFALAEDLLGKNRAFVADVFGAVKGFITSLSETEVVEMPAKKAA